MCFSCAACHIFILHFRGSKILHQSRLIYFFFYSNKHDMACMFWLSINDYSVCLERNFNAPHGNITSRKMMPNQNSCLKPGNDAHSSSCCCCCVTVGIKTTLTVATAEMSFIKVSHLCAQAGTTGAKKNTNAPHRQPLPMIGAEQPC